MNKAEAEKILREKVKAGEGAEIIRRAQRLNHEGRLTDTGLEAVLYYVAKAQQEEQEAE